MSQDIDTALQGWEFKPGVVQARLVAASDGRQVIQMRVDLGVLQIETSGRPDGMRPHGSDTYFEYLRQQSSMSAAAGQPFTLGEEQCQEADREFLQFYHRRLCWLALRNYVRAMADADHTLGFMDFIGAHSPSEEYTKDHEQYRGFVLFQRTQAAAALAVEQHNPEAAIDAINEGLERLRAFFTAHGREDLIDHDVLLDHLRQLGQSLRQSHGIEATLREQLDRAVANEEYETAARIRDELKKGKS